MNNRPQCLIGIKPGLYLFKSYYSFYLRVLSDNSIQQVNPETGENDGELSDEGWRIDQDTQTACLKHISE